MSNIKAVSLLIAFIFTLSSPFAFASNACISDDNTCFHVTEEQQRNIRGGTVLGIASGAIALTGALLISGFSCYIGFRKNNPERSGRAILLFSMVPLVASAYSIVTAAVTYSHIKDIGFSS